MKRLLCALGLVVFAVAPALADPKSDLMAAMLQFGKATTYHMDVSAKGHTMAADMALPNKMHMMTPEFEMIKIDSTTWMKIGGKWRQFTVPGMDQITGVFNNAIATAHGAPEDLVVSDLGMKSPAGGGGPLHAYQVTNKSGKTPSTIFLDDNTLVEVDTIDGTFVKFSKYNVPVDITPPS
jgi:hypothetical protein